MNPDQSCQPTASSLFPGVIAFFSPLSSVLSSGSRCVGVFIFPGTSIESQNFRLISYARVKEHGIRNETWANRNQPISCIRFQITYPFNGYSYYRIPTSARSTRPWHFVYFTRTSSMLWLPSSRTSSLLLSPSYGGDIESHIR